MNENKFIDFAKNTLGCGCPDEVFEYIQYVGNIKISDDLVLTARINIGNRLLIYITDMDKHEISSVIINSVKHGINDRNTNNFNRLRLVMGVDNPQEIQEKAIEVFEGLAPDEKTHLHILSKQQIAGILH